MQLSFMTFSCPEFDWKQVLDEARRVGAQAVEPRVDAGHKHGIELAASAEARRAIRAQAVDAGVAIGCLATGCRYADPTTADAQAQLTRRYLDLAADVDCGRLRVFGGNFPAEVTREQAKASLVRTLTSLAGEAQHRGVTLCLETHDAWTHPDDVADVMRQVNHPAVAVNWDVLHPWRTSGWPLQDAFAVLETWVRHVHVHDGSADHARLQLLPIGSSGVDHCQVIRLLEQAGYEGYLSGEWIESTMTPSFYAVHLETELATLRAMLAEAHEAKQVHASNHGIAGV